MISLADLRAKLDAIDAKLVSLLGERAELALQVKAVKAKDDIDIYSVAREREIIERALTRGAAGAFPTPALERVFSAILSATRSLVGELSVAYVGPELSRGHHAAHRQFGADVRYFPASSVEEIFRKVGLGEIRYGVVPADSSEAVTPTFECFLSSPLRVIAEIILEGKLSLWSQSPTLSGLQRVYGDAAGISRVSRWTRANLSGVEFVVVESVAVAAEFAIQAGTAGVISGDLAGDRFSLGELASGIEDGAGGKSRFFVIAQKPADRTGRDKTSLLCVVKDRAGALKDLLTPFADSGVTLTKIESRPLHNWEYAFVIDLLGHVSDSAVQAAVQKIETQCSLFKLLGSYPHA